MRVEPVTRGGLAAMHVEVEVDHAAHPHHRHLPEIAGLIVAAGLPGAVADRALAVFQRLARAEAAVHGIPIEQVHFHEVGAADAIVDIVGACAGIEFLGIEKVVCSPIPTGSGVVRCEHGVLPVPAPATANLLNGVPLAVCDEEGELTTPTGAAILTTLAESYGPLPSMRLETVGYGAGTRENRTRPNVLRLLVGQVEPEVSAERDFVAVLEAQVDDSTGQVVAYACERLLAVGALDAYIVPIIMKKGRPGQLMTVLCRPDDVAAMERVLFEETTTLGVRRHDAARTKLPRETVEVATRFGPIRLKLARPGEPDVQAWPEYEDCVAAARACGVPLREVQHEALRVWAEQKS
jgi:pyridinium-3,5-bisthiocarboxylic acid mononucleotide nickel chelatase